MKSTFQPATLTLRALAIAALLAAASSHAEVSVKDAWVRATVPQQKSSGAFMQLSATADTRLVEVKSSVAKIVEIHEMKMAGDVMQMKAVPGVDLPAGKAIELKPGGYHVMLMDLKQQLKVGDTVPLTLVVEGRDKKRETIEVKAVVRALSAPSGAMHKP